MFCDKKKFFFSFLAVKVPPDLATLLIRSIFLNLPFWLVVVVRIAAAVDKFFTMSQKSSTLFCLPLFTSFFSFFFCELAFLNILVGFFSL